MKSSNWGATKRSQIIALAKSEQELSPAEIAERLGSTEGSVITILSEAGLRRNRTVNGYEMSAHAKSMFESAARDRRISTRELVRRVLNAVADGELFKAVLDD